MERKIVGSVFGERGEGRMGVVVAGGGGCCLGVMYLEPSYYDITSLYPHNINTQTTFESSTNPLKVLLCIVLLRQNRPPFRKKKSRNARLPPPPLILLDFT